VDSATPKPKARSQPFVGLAAKGPRKSDLLGHTLRPVPLLAGGESPRVRRSPPRRRGTLKGRDARGYVRRFVSPDEVEELLDNPRLVEAARKKMEQDLSSYKLDLRKPTRRVDGTVAEWLPKRL
jgi:hypothetical protein